ncbi:MAG: hypothetical protein JXR85_02105 [Deltaproteobacteria bacterium]|nr:hypothetical protein [Deltaproteobacteria bacterium]
MTDQHPTMKEYAALYEAAHRFKELRCWDWMTDEDLFGVRNRETGDIGWCCVLGNLGQVYGLVIYLGDEGLRGYIKLQTGEVDLHDPDSPHLQKCLMLSFDDRDQLEKEDLRVIKQLGLTFRGRNAWPLLRNYEPGYVPWFITSEQARFLADAIKQAINVTVRFRKNTDLLYPGDEDLYLVRVPRGSRTSPTWHDEYIKPELAAVPAGIDDRIDEIRVQKIKMNSKPSGATWEIGYCYAPTPIQEHPSMRPYCPKMLVVIDHGSKLIVTLHVAEDPHVVDECRNHFLELLETMNHFPSHIFVSREEARLLLDPITSRLGIIVHMMDRLDVFEDFYFSMFEYMR